MSCSKIPAVARVITSDFGARPILGELLYQLHLSSFSNRANSSERGSVLLARSPTNSSVIFARDRANSNCLFKKSRCEKSISHALNVQTDNKYTVDLRDSVS